MTPGPRIGIDFDNTIVCYDQVFTRLAVEEGLVPAGAGMSKTAIRNYLRAADREDEWTRLQGRVYGAAIERADPFPGAMAFFERCRALDVDVFVVSHKTRHPVLGDPCDLHEAAARWLEARGFFDPSRTNLTRDRVWFELTKHEKLWRIDALRCTHFVDDLVELLAEHAFPRNVERILFDPNQHWTTPAGMHHVASWADVSELTLRPLRTHSDDGRRRA